MTNQYMNNLYRDLLSNSPQTITIDIPTDMGTGQISQIVTKQGAVVSDWRMNYFSDMNVQGVSSEEYIQMLFCFNDGVSGILQTTGKVPAYKRVNPVFIAATGKWNICAILKRAISFSKM